MTTFEMTMPVPPTKNTAAIANGFAVTAGTPTSSAPAR
jgi:hypothetical protein